MKRTRLFLFLALLAWAGIAKAANDKLVIQDVTMEAGSSVTLDVVLENETTNLMGFQCDIAPPEGLTLKLKNIPETSGTLFTVTLQADASLSPGNPTSFLRIAWR